MRRFLICLCTALVAMVLVAPSTFAQSHFGPGSEPNDVFTSSPEVGEDDEIEGLDLVSHGERGYDL